MLAQVERFYCFFLLPVFPFVVLLSGRTAEHPSSRYFYLYTFNCKKKRPIPFPISPRRSVFFLLFCPLTALRLYDFFSLTALLTAANNSLYLMMQRAFSSAHCFSLRLHASGSKAGRARVHFNVWRFLRLGIWVGKTQPNIPVIQSLKISRSTTLSYAQFDVPWSLRL